MMPNPTRIGIIGTGIAGLAAGKFLRDAGFAPILFEKNDQIGIDSHGVSVPTEDGPLRLDVPPRMLNQALWPELRSLYQSLGIEIQPVEPSKVFWIDSNGPMLKLEKSFFSSGMIRQLLSVEIRDIFRDIQRMKDSVDQDITQFHKSNFREYLNGKAYSRSFIYQFLLPALSSTLCTCSYQALDNYPVDTLLLAMKGVISSEGLFRTCKGTHEVAHRLTEEAEVRLSCPIDSIEICGKSVRLRFDSNSTPSVDLDHVIVATQANTASRLIAGQPGLPHDILAGFQYESVTTVVHSDETLMPPHRKDWASFNLQSNADGTAGMCTMWMNRYYGFNGNNLFQTIMPYRKPEASKVIKMAEMQRPVVNADSKSAIAQLGKYHSSADRIWFCGSYAAPGVPLLESGVQSARAVVDRIVSKQACQATST
ncbi:MAG: FAD-dependent oxidoreductase [Planctomycetota bacterium]